MNISIGVRVSKPDKPSCFCPACTITECRMKKEGKRKMEKFKEGLMYVACIILPPVMLVFFVLGMAAIMNWAFNSIVTKEDQTQVKQNIQTVQNAGKKVWSNFESWANEE